MIYSLPMNLEQSQNLFNRESFKDNFKEILGEYISLDEKRVKIITQFNHLSPAPKKTAYESPAYKKEEHDIKEQIKNKYEQLVDVTKQLLTHSKNEKERTEILDLISSNFNDLAYKEWGHMYGPTDDDVRHNLMERIVLALLRDKNN